MPKLINQYIARYFLTWVGIVLLALIGLMAFGGFVENLNLAQKIGGTAGQAILLTLYSIPELIAEIAPFIFLFASLVTYLRLNESQAISIFRASGQSVWQFSAPTLLITFVLAILTVLIIDPLASVSRQKRDQLENQILGRDAQLNVLSTGVWIRIPQNSGYDLIRGREIKDPTSMQLNHVDLYHYDADGRLSEHIIAETAALSDNQWLLQTQAGPYALASPQTLSVTQLRERLLSSYAEPIWRLPTQIQTGEEAGLDMTHLRLRFHSLLALPLFCVFMVLIAIAFSLPRGRIASTGRTVTLAIILGFGAYAGSQLVAKIAQLSLLPVAAAAWIPTLVLLLITLSILIEREEG